MHTSVFIVSLLKWSLNFEIIPGIPPRIDLILLVLICRVTPNDYIKLWVLIYKVHPTSHTYVRIYMQVHPKNYENKYTTIQCIKLYCPGFGLSTFWFVDVLVCRCFGMSTFWGVLVCRCFGLSTFWSVDVLVCRCFGMSTFWFVDALVCRRFGLSTFRFVDVLVVDVSVCRRFDQSPTKGSSFCKRQFEMDFFNDIFYHLVFHEFYFLNIIYILLYTDLILSIFSNIQIF